MNNCIWTDCYKTQRTFLLSSLLWRLGELPYCVNINKFLHFIFYSIKNFITFYSIKSLPLHIVILGEDLCVHKEILRRHFWEASANHEKRGRRFISASVTSFRCDYLSWKAIQSSILTLNQNTEALKILVVPLASTPPLQIGRLG